MSFFSKNATISQTHSTTKPSGLSGCSTFSLTTQHYGKEIITTQYIDLTGLNTGDGTSGVIANSLSGSNNFLFRHREYDYGRIYKIEMSALDYPNLSDSNSYSVGLAYDTLNNVSHNTNISYNNLIAPTESWSSIFYKQDASASELSSFYYSSANIGNYDWTYTHSSQTWSTSIAHGRVVGDIVRVSYVPFVEGGAQPSQYVEDKNYFVVDTGSTTTFKLSETENGDPVSTTTDSNANWSFNHHDRFIYLVGGNDSTTGTSITSGKFLMKFYGHEI